MSGQFVGHNGQLVKPGTPFVGKDGTLVLTGGKLVGNEGQLVSPAEFVRPGTLFVPGCIGIFVEPGCQG